MTQPRIAVLGLGIMGHGIATNYLKAGYEIVVWNRTPKKADDLVSAGAIRATIPAEAVRDADIIFDVTANDESSRFVFTDPEVGAFTSARNDQTFITCATLSLDWTMELAGLCSERGLTFFDMPMTGSRAGAEGGSLLLLCGGDKEKFDALVPHLKAITSECKYFGDAGAGMKYKLILNAIQAAHVIAFGEAMRQVSAVGVDLKQAAESMAEKPGGYPTQMAHKYYPSPATPTNFSVKWILKDLKYAREMLKNSAYQASTDVTMLDVSISVLQKANDEGRGDEDWTVVNAPLPEG